MAVNKQLATLEDELEVMTLLADMIKKIYALESELLRAQKFVAKKGEEKRRYHMAIAKVYINDTIPNIVHWAKQVFAFIEESDALVTQFSLIDKLATYRPINTIAPRSLIEEKVIKGKRDILFKSSNKNILITPFFLCAPRGKRMKL